MRQHVATFFVSLFSKVIVILFGWLRRHSYEKSQNLLLKISQIDTQDMGQSKIIRLMPFNKTSHKISHEKGFSLDATSLEVSNNAIPDWSKEAILFIQNQLSDNTRQAYRNDLKQFFHFLEGRLQPFDVKNLKTEHVILYRKYLEEGRLTSRIMKKPTINRKLATIKSFLNWLKVNRIIFDNPALLVKGYPQSQESALKGFSDEEVRKILRAPNRNSCSGALHLAILYVLFYLGLRKGELIQLKMGDLDTERGVDVLKVRGKGHKIRILPITKQLKETLFHYFIVCKRDHNDTESHLFQRTKNPRKSTEKGLNPFAITYIISHYAKKAGVLKQISPHSARATCISNALDRRATHRSVQHLAGWSTPLMIQRYDKRREDLKNSAAYLVDYEDSISPA